MYPHERSLVKNMSGRPFVLLGVNNDEEIETVKKAIKKNNLNWRSWCDGDGGPIVKEFGIHAFPTVFLIDHEGVIRYRSSEHPEIRHPEVLEEAVEMLVSTAESAGMTGGSEPSSKLREFADISGKHRITGAYTDFAKGTVYLQNEDNKEIKVPWAKLSLEDRQYIALQRLKGSGLDRIAKAKTLIPFDDLHEFTDKSGEHSIKATYIGLDRTSVIFWDENGNEIKTRYRDLSDTSRDYIAKENKRRKGSE